MPAVSVASTVLNESADIDSLVESLMRQTLAPAEVIIVDGGSTDGTWERLEAARAKHPALVAIRDESCSLLRSPGPIARGRNVAIAAASSDIVACADAGCNNALSRDRAGDVNTLACRTEQAQNTLITNAGCKAVTTNVRGCGDPRRPVTCACTEHQASNTSIANSGREAFAADNAFGRDHAKHTIAGGQARAHAETGNAANAIRSLKAGHGVATAGSSGRRCPAGGVTTSRACRESSYAACSGKADRAGS